MHAKLPLLVGAVFLGGVLAAVTPHASAYPDKPIDLIIPYAPGGSIDILGRVMQPLLASELGKPVVVQNMGGAGGALGTAAAARAQPDGHTFVITTNAVLTISPHVQKNLGFDPQKDFAPVSLVATGPMAIGVSGASGITTLQQLVDRGRSGKNLTYATPGVGSPHHLTGEFFAKEAGIGMTHVPYKGIANGIADLLGGHVDLAISTVSSFVPLLAENRVRILAVTTASRYDALPDVPSIAETFPGFEADAWFGAMVPAGTPQEAVDKLGAAIAHALKDEAVQKVLQDAALVPVGKDSAALADLIEKDYQHWGAIVRESGITPE